MAKRKTTPKKAKKHPKQPDLAVRRAVQGSVMLQPGSK